MDTGTWNQNSSEWNLEEELEKNQNLNRDTVESLRDFCISIPSSEASAITDELMVALLHSNNYELERAQTAATKYLEIRANSPEVFQNREVDGEDFKFGLDTIYFCPLPNKTPDGYRIVLHKIRKTDILAYKQNPVSKFQFLTLDCLCHEEPTCAGYIFVCDMRDVSVGHILKSSLFLVRKLLRYTQEGIPLIIKEISIIYASNISERILGMTKPFMKKRMLDTIRFYSVDQMEDFWIALPKQYFPQEYGGNLPDVETLHQNQIRWLREIQPKVDTSA